MPKVKEIQIGEEKFVVKFTLGLTRLIAARLLELFNTMGSEEGFSEEQKTRRRELLREYVKAKNNSKVQEKIMLQLNELYLEVQMFGDKGNILGIINQSGDARVELAAILLTQRGEKGKVTREVTREEIEYSIEFTDAMLNEESELNQLIDEAIEDFSEQLKKDTKMQKKMAGLFKNVEKLTKK